MANQGNQSDTTPNQQTELRGGTEGGVATPNVHVGSTSGGTNSVSPTGASQRDQGPDSPPGGGVPRSGGQYTDSRHDAEHHFESSRADSPSVAKQRARDAADAPTEPRTPHGAGEPRHHQIEPTE